MAKCSDCIHYSICSLWTTTDLEKDEAHKYCYGNFKPTADVVPKSEVEELKADLEVWKQNRFNIFQMLELYKMTRQEAALEIFEEITEKLEGLFDFFRQDDGIRESGAIMLAISEIAELKKKYTEN